jgi:hypothetical protein
MVVMPSSLATFILTGRMLAGKRFIGLSASILRGQRSGAFAAGEGMGQGEQEKPKLALS